MAAVGDGAKGVSSLEKCSLLDDCEFLLSSRCRSDWPRASQKAGRTMKINNINNTIKDGSLDCFGVFAKLFCHEP